MLRGSSEQIRARLRATLRTLRQAARLRQADLAHRLDQPQSFVSKYESGERDLGFAEVLQICEALQVPFSTFMSAFEEKQ